MGRPEAARAAPTIFGPVSGAPQPASSARLFDYSRNMLEIRLYIQVAYSPYLLSLDPHQPADLEGVGLEA